SEFGRGCLAANLIRSTMKLHTMTNKGKIGRSCGDTVGLQRVYSYLQSDHGRHCPFAAGSQTRTTNGHSRLIMLDWIIYCVGLSAFPNHTHEKTPLHTCCLSLKWNFH